MATIHGPKFTGPILIDLANVKDELVDLPNGALRGARAEKEGLDAVLTELAIAIPGHSEEAEIHPALYQRVLGSTASINKLREHELALEKALEVCRETRGQKENNREDDLSAIAIQVEERAAQSKNPGLRAHFEKTIEYRSRFGDKSADTRRKNEEAKEAANNASPPQPAPPVS